MKYQTIRDVDVKDKVVLVRVDYNVPMEDGEIVDDLRIRASLPTLEYLRKAGVKKIVLISHMGRPEGRDESLSLKKVAEALGEMLPNVSFVPEVSGANVKKIVEEAKPGSILLLENLRFSPDEEKNSEDFIKSIIDAAGAELYVQDGFAVIHRAHASVAAVAKFLPVYMGLLLEKEVKNLEKVASNPERPMLVIIGGSKVEDKAPLIEKFIEKADKIAVGGKIAADGYKAEENAQNIYVAEDFDENVNGEKLDIGPLSTAKIAGFITDAKTIVWNGLLGKAEDPAYATASTIVAEMIGEKEDAETVICGGDTTGFVEGLMKEHSNLKYSLVSTGGGAALEFLIGKELPGLEAIKKN
jgi:phosphoglycerate kinase